MAGPIANEVIEEDAADLQFPKDEINVEADWLELSYKIQETCAICKKELKEEPIIRCHDCSCLDLCVQCFSLGLETQQHENHHKYQVDRRHSPIFLSSDWPAEMELDLINAVIEFGYGNWCDIAKRIPNKTKDEIKSHFNTYYIDNKDNLPDFHAFGLNLRTSVRTNPSYKFSASAICEEPPRFPINTPQYRYFAGYNAARSDFEIEYDNSAEMLISNLDFDTDMDDDDEVTDDDDDDSDDDDDDSNDNDDDEDDDDDSDDDDDDDDENNDDDDDYGDDDVKNDESDDDEDENDNDDIDDDSDDDDDIDDNDNDEEGNCDRDLMREFKLTLVQQYNERLKERLRRKRIIRNHGLLLLRKFPITLNKYESSITKSALERLYPFMQLVSGIKFDYILEGLDKEMELKRYFLRLKNFRECGLTRFYSCKIYEKLKTARDEMMKELNQLKQNPIRSLASVNLEVKPLITRTVTTTRKPAPPLNILLLPGYEKLTEEERELCSVARIVPESYFTFKELLINENKKNNGIRLATARQLIKIDVNKTRKLFNFLRDKNLITQIP